MDSHIAKIAEQTALGNYLDRKQPALGFLRTCNSTLTERCAQ
jgi:hypothetical protein